MCGHDVGEARDVTWLGAVCLVRTVPRQRRVSVELGQLNFVLLDYSVEYRTKDSSTRLIPKVAIDCRVVQNQRTPVCSTTVLQNE